MYFQDPMDMAQLPVSFRFITGTRNVPLQGPHPDSFEDAQLTTSE